MMIEWPPTYKQLLFFATFPILYVWEATAAFLHLFLSIFVKQLLLFLPNLPSPPLSFVLSMMKLSKSIHYMKYELMIKTCEELGIISSRPYITFSSLLCYDALMLQVHDQMMIDMFLRPLLLLVLVF